MPLVLADASLLVGHVVSPATLAFTLGLLAALVRSDLRFPEAATAALSIYLLLAIGLKGGAALADAPVADMLPATLVTLALGIVTPFIAYLAARRFVGLSRVDGAAIAAHYGSVSAVTFLAALAYVEGLGQPAESFFPGLVALLEVPAIVLGLAVARSGGAQGGLGAAILKVLTGKSVLLLAGGLAIGLAVGPAGLGKVRSFFVEPFQGVLVLFLLDLGVVAGGHLRHLRRAGPRLAAFAILLPLVHGALGTWAGTLVGLSPGGTAVLGAMTASASYIAAPAAVRTALPEADPALYLTASLGITFPFNLTLGIPLYVELAQRWQ